MLFFEDGLDGSIAEDVVDKDPDGVLLLGVERGAVVVVGVLFEEAAVFCRLLWLIDLLPQQQFALLCCCGHFLRFTHVTLSFDQYFIVQMIMQKLYTEVIKIVIINNSK